MRLMKKKGITVTFDEHGDGGVDDDDDGGDGDSGGGDGDDL